MIPANPDRLLLLVRLAGAVFLAALILAGCRPRGAGVEPAFFHWQTHLALTSAERAYLDSLNAKRLYVKFFDVDWEGGAVPRASLIVDTAHLAGLAITPVVFITNRTMEQLPGEEIDVLAGRMVRKLSGLVARLPAGTTVSEVQIDCDWTPGTRERYFALLDALRPPLRERGFILSATIRLHQVRYVDQTGAPPVDRGLLMCYNVGEVSEWADDNSILRPGAVRPYLRASGRYPLPLDLGLPAYAWGAVFRQGRLIRLIHGLRPVALADTSRFAKRAPHRFEVVKSTYLDGYYLYRGDRIRTEAADADSLRATAALLAPRFGGQAFTLAFYHLDTTTIKHYPHEELEEIARILENR